MPYLALHIVATLLLLIAFKLGNHDAVISPIARSPTGGIRRRRWGAQERLR